MKPIIVFFAGLSAGLLIVFVLCITHLMPIECSNCYDDTQGIVLGEGEGVEINEDQFDLFSNNFKGPGTLALENKSNGRWGGQIGVLALRNMLAKIDLAQTPVKFIEIAYGYNNTTPQYTGTTYLMLCRPEFKTMLGCLVPAYYCRTGDTYIAWCPPRCRGGGSPTPAAESTPTPAQGPVPNN